MDNLNNITPMKGLPPFLQYFRTIGIIPASYKVSMTYEEQVLELMRFIKEEIIPKINENVLATQELQEKFKQLVTYVDEYFENLDIQTEVNTKLDEMATDGTLAEIINQEIFGDLQNQINANTTNINDLRNDFADYPFFNMLLNNGYTDGSTPNDTVFSNAKNQGFRKFYFPQNENNNASYYFTNTPNFNECEIKTDEGVILSLPNCFGVTNTNNGIYKSNIKFNYRNQNQQPLIPSNISDFYNMLHVATDYRLKNLSAPLFSNSDLKFFKYNYGSTFLFTELDKTDYYEENNTLINRKSGTQNNLYGGLCLPITERRNCIETCTNGENTQLHPVILNSQTGEGFYTDYTGTIMRLYHNSSTAQLTDRFNMFIHNLGANNDWSLKCQYKIRYNKENNHVQFIFNEGIVADIELPFIPDYFGFGIIDNNTNHKMTRFTRYYQENLPLNYNMKILIVGDSRFAGDGQTYKINDILKNGLLYNGINKVEIDNLAVSGYTIDQIFNLLNSTDLTQYDVIIYEGGINNYGTSQTDIAYKLNDVNLLLKNSGALIVFTTCMPCGWGGSDTHAQDRARQYYGIVNAMLLGIASNPNNNNIIIANNLGNQKNDSNLPVCSDGVHPNVIGLIEIARNIISGLFNHYKINY